VVDSTASHRHTTNRLTNSDKIKTDIKRSDVVVGLNVAMFDFALLDGIIFLADFFIIVFFILLMVAHLNSRNQSEGDYYPSSRFFKIFI